MYITSIKQQQHNKAVNFQMVGNIEPVIANRIDKFGRPYKLTLKKQFHPNSNIKSQVEILIEYIKYGVAKKITKIFSPEKVIKERIEMGGGKNSNYKKIQKYNENGRLAPNKESFCDTGNDFNLD